MLGGAVSERGAGRGARSLREVLGRGGAEGGTGERCWGERCAGSKEMRCGLIIPR